MTEFEALKMIDQALAALDDNPTRDRVLRWACQKYIVAVAPMASAVGGTVTVSTPERRHGARSKGKSRTRSSTSGSPSIVRDLNLKPKGKDPFDEFAAQKRPASHKHRCVVAVYYLAHELDLSAITVNHVFTCFKHMQWRVPSNLANTLAYVASVHGWLDTRSMADIKITTIGENLVEHDLPESADDTDRG
jgi:hypothetical protein